jgi:hypothetical protein
MTASSDRLALVMVTVWGILVSLKNGGIVRK